MNDGVFGCPTTRPFDLQTKGSSNCQTCWLKDHLSLEHGTNKHICGYKGGLIVVMVVLGYGVFIHLQITVTTLNTQEIIISFENTEYESWTCPACIRGLSIDMEYLWLQLLLSLMNALLNAMKASIERLNLKNQSVCALL